MNNQNKEEKQQFPRIYSRYEELSDEEWVQIISAVSEEDNIFEGVVLLHANLFNMPIDIARDEIKQVLTKIKYANSLFDKKNLPRVQKMKITKKAKEAMKEDSK